VKQIIRWGIWGSGTIAHKLASDVRLADGAVLHAVASRTEEHARQFAQQFGAAKWYGGLEPLLNDPEVDAVYIATPNHRHMDDCIAAVEAGKAVLCEKPFALSHAQTQRIVDAARRRKVFCMEAMWTRFIPAVIEARRLIDTGAIGTVRLIQGHFAFPARVSNDARHLNIAMGGGALLDIGVYPISFAHYLLGAPQSIKGTAYIGPTGVDLQSAYQLGFANGVMADLWSSFLIEGTNDFTVFGDDGMLRLCKPFYAAHRLILQTGKNPGTAGQHPKSAPSGLRKFFAGLRDTPAAWSVRRRLSPALEALSGGSARSLPFPGKGYQFEINEVNRCLREQRTESAVMPLDGSLAVMRTMDALRAQWGLVYPQE